MCCRHKAYSIGLIGLMRLMGLMGLMRLMGHYNNNFKN